MFLGNYILDAFDDLILKVFIYLFVTVSYESETNINKFNSHILVFNLLLCGVGFCGAG